jgi:hypothetical protein
LASIYRSNQRQNGQIKRHRLRTVVARTFTSMVFSSQGRVMKTYFRSLWQNCSKYVHLKD